MIILNRENIIDGILEIENHESKEYKKIVTEIRYILTLKETSDLEKLQSINKELSKILI